MRRLAGLNCSPELMLAAMIADDLHRWLWWHTKEGHDGKEMPVSMLEQVLGREKKHACRGFESGEELMEALRAYETEPGRDMCG
jgi:hypothetical protein